jgi:hypothetical protein
VDLKDEKMLHKTIFIEVNKPRDKNNLINIKEEKDLIKKQREVKTKIYNFFIFSKTHSNKE